MKMGVQSSYKVSVESVWVSRIGGPLIKKPKNLYKYVNQNPKKICTPVNVTGTWLPSSRSTSQSFGVWYSHRQQCHITVSFVIVPLIGLDVAIFPVQLICWYRV